MATHPIGRIAKGSQAPRLAFVSPTTVYAFMQAMGLVNDHVHDCDSRAAATRARSGFKLPR
jgi:3-methyladenine DNA glycosylase Tag